MKKNRITGWKDVYDFTITQNIKNKSYIISTIVITLFIVIISVGINLLPAIILDKQSQTEQDVIDIDTLYIYDHSGLDDIDYSGLTKNEQLPELVQIVETTSNETEVKVEENKKDMMIEIQATQPGFVVLGTVPEESGVSDEDAEKIVSLIKTYFREEHYTQLGITKEQVMINDLSISTSVTMLAKEQENFISIIVNYFVNLALIMVFMLLINSYGKMTASIVAMEKSSKVLELLFTSVRPIATILGKILAMTTLILGQLVLWIVVAVISYVGSNLALRLIDGKYSSGLKEVIEMLNGSGIHFNLSPFVIVLSIAILVTGFAFYITIAGLIGATVGKIEELGQAIQYFAFIVLIGAYIPLFGFINMVSVGSSNIMLIKISRILPISSMYLVPSEMILGRETLSAGFIALGVNIVALFLLMLFVSKVYESVILYSGNRLKLKDIIRISKNQ